MTERPDPFPTLNLSPTLEPLMAGVEGDIRAALDRVASMRFRHVQLSATQPGVRPRELDQSARRDLLATLRRKELDLSGIDLWIPPGHFTDPANADRAVSAVQQAIEFAADLGRKPLSLMLPGAGAKPPPPLSPESVTASPSTSLASIDQALDALIAHADRHGVELADHAIPPSRRDGIAAGIDPATWLAQGMDPVTALFSIGEQLVAARLDDLLTTGLRGPIGDPQHGRLDVQAYQATLSAIGYRRAVVIDARQWSEPWDGLAQTANAWRASGEF